MHNSCDITVIEYYTVLNQMTCTIMLVMMMTILLSFIYQYTEYSYITNVRKFGEINFLIFVI